MPLYSFRRHFTGLLLLLAAIFLISACGGGGSGGGGATLNGTAATGAPVTGFVYVIDSAGVEVNVPINPDGTFSVPVSGMTPPFLLRAVPDGGGDILYSFASDRDITVNITPLTTLSLHLASGGGLAGLYDTWSSNSDALDDGGITGIQAVINANLAGLFGQFEVDASYYDFMHAGFTADGTGIDGVLDMLAISVEYDGAAFTVSIDGVPEFSWNPEIDISGINIGDFPIPDTSIWRLTVTDPANNIDYSEIVSGLYVPNSLDDFEGITDETLYGQIVIEGLEISFDISNFSLDVFGSGEVGTLIVGQFTGSITLNGEIEGQVYNNVTYSFDTTFVWERLADI